VIRTISQAALATAMLMGTAEYAAGQPVEVMLRDASCYPDPGCAGGGAPMDARIFNTNPGHLGSRYGHGISVLPFTCDRPIVLTRVEGVGDTNVVFSLEDWENFAWYFNAWTDLEAFRVNPTEGDLVSNVRLEWTPPTAHFGQSPTNYFVSLELSTGDQFVLPSGAYVVSVHADRDLANWYWNESTVDLGCDHMSHHSQPGEVFNYCSDLGYSHGSQALDIFGYEITCVGDFNFDGVIDLSDLGTLLANFEVGDGMTYEQGDIDFDGDVDLSDLGALLAVYEVPCE
jgi:hypothetical protein